MAERLLKEKKGSVALVATYKDKQLAWVNRQLAWVKRIPLLEASRF